MMNAADKLLSERLLPLTVEFREHNSRINFFKVFVTLGYAFSYAAVRIFIVFSVVGNLVRFLN